MNEKDKYALVVSENISLGYTIMEKDTRSYVLIDDTTEARKLIDILLNTGCEVFETEGEFNRIYRPLTAEERLRMSKEFFERKK
ncbi:MAG: hypothetical protein BGO69_08635 [Bacteroidetes bacterium 46-16]|nr:MAG: hypothetical protein BGO69_08635 [Bacteroidetes bacterium 46-16]